MTIADHPSNLETFREEATNATDAADAVRERVTAADSTVTAADLATAEASERLARLRLEAAEHAHVAQQQVEDEQRLQADRAAMQAEYAAAHAPGADADVEAALASAVEAALAYVTAARDRAEYLHDVSLRAQALGFDAPTPTFRSPLPALGNAIVAEVRNLLPLAHTFPVLDAVNDRIWGD